MIRAADARRRAGEDAMPPEPTPASWIALRDDQIAPRREPSADEWEALLAVASARRLPKLRAKGWMTDEVLARVADLDGVTELRLGGTGQITDDGLRHLQRMPQLRHLELNGHPNSRLTDRGLAVLRHLPELRSFEMTWQPGITDAGAASLRFCERLESVDLMGTPTGDGAVAALAGKPWLRRFQSGHQVTDAGLALLRAVPAFRGWREGEVRLSLMGAEAEPARLLLDGPFTDAGLAQLAGLEGIFDLSLFWHTTALTPDGLKALAQLPNL